MMIYIGFDREEEAERWARERINQQAEPTFFRAMSAVDKDGNFVCVVIFSNFSVRNVDLNIVIDAKKFTPKACILMFNKVFGYVFDKLKVSRATGLVKGKNAKSKQISEHFGFKLEGIMRKSFDDDDLHIYGFLAEDYYNHAWHRG